MESARSNDEYGGDRAAHGEPDDIDVWQGETID
jgi:hypothetical protein